MCVKEFLGYNCGHCSIPYLRKCPVTASNHRFPVCKFPAERPIYANDYCHACTRVLWNAKVLKDEEEHRLRHKRGECNCEVIFDAEERGRRVRPRSGKGKGKETDVQVLQDGDDTIQGNASNAGGEQSVRHDPEEDHGGVQHEDTFDIEPRNSDNTRRTWIPEARMAAYEYVGYYVAGANDTEYGVDGNEQMDMNTAIAQVEHGYGFPPGGHVPQESMWRNQVMLGQPGAGMQWYSQSQVEMMPPLLQLPLLAPAPVQLCQTPPPSHSAQPSLYKSNTERRTWQKAMSEPAEPSTFIISPVITVAQFCTETGRQAAAYAEAATTEMQSSAGTLAEELPRQPAIVSSEMAFS